MRPLSYLISLFLIFVVVHAQEEDSLTLEVRIDADTNQFNKVWIGVFDLPLRPGAEARNWTEAESSEFTLSIPNEDELQIVALRKNSLPVVQRILPRSADKQLLLKFEEGTTLEGTIISSDNVPVADAEVTLDREDIPQVLIPDRVRSSWKSDADGQFKIGGLAPDVDYKIEVQLRYVQNETFVVKIGENDGASRDFRLSDAFYVMGRVIDQDRTSVQDATVRYQPEGVEGEPRTNTNDEGKFRLGPFVRNKEIRLSARHDERGSSKNFRATAGEHDVELVLGSMVQVLGTVVDASTREPVDDFTLHAIRADGSQKYPHIGSKGEISSAVDPVTTALIVDSEEHNAHFITDLTLESVDEYDLGEIALSPGRELRGQVYDASTREPVVGARVSLVDYDWTGDVDDQWSGLLESFLFETVQSTTNEKGEYLLKSLPEDSVDVHAWAWDYQAQELSVDKSATVLDIALVRTEDLKTRIQGRIETAAGEPIGGSVSFRSEEGMLIDFAQDDGLFDTPMSAGTYDVQASTDQGNSDPVRVILKEDETKEIRLVVESKGRLSGVVDGLWEGETVVLSVLSEPEGVGVRSVSRIENGDFQVVGVGYGEFTLKARSTRNREQEKSFELSAENGEAFLELHFTGNSRLYGTLRFPDGSHPKGEVKAIAKQSGKTSSLCEINDDGTYEIKGLDDGEYTVRTFESKMVTVTHDGGSFSRGSTAPIDDVDVVVRGDTEHNIQLSPRSDTE